MLARYDSGHKGDLCVVRNALSLANKSSKTSINQQNWQCLALLTSAVAVYCVLLLQSDVCSDLFYLSLRIFLVVAGN